MSWYLWAADAVLIVHASFIAFVVFGLLVIWGGIGMGWKWVRNRWFRSIHLAAIGYVVLQSWLAIACPLTLLENHLRVAGGQDPYGPAGFIEHWLHRLIFFTAPPWVFVTAYTLFGLAVAGTMVVAPPRWRGAPVEAASRIPDTSSTSA